MKKEYSDRKIVAVDFEQDQIKEINKLALRLERSRNSVIRRLTKIALEEVSKGRRIFGG